jgi:hypothetical protein
MLVLAAHPGDTFRLADNPEVGPFNDHKRVFQD